MLINNVIESLGNGIISNTIDGWRLSSDRDLTPDDTKSIISQLEKGATSGDSPCRWELTFDNKSEHSTH